MKVILKYISLTSLVVMLGCSPAASPELPIEVQSVDLPLQLTDYYLAAFEAAPELTAKKFLAAHESFAERGAVTEVKILNHARFQTSLERGQILGIVMAYDLNGDRQITRAEYDSLEVVPKASNRVFAEQSLFHADLNQDDNISVQEAMSYSNRLYDHRAKQNLRPIESYLMLFDVNADGDVTRTEMRMGLKPYLEKGTAGHGQHSGSISGAPVSP